MKSYYIIISYHISNQIKSYIILYEIIYIISTHSKQEIYFKANEVRRGKQNRPWQKKELTH